MKVFDSVPVKIPAKNVFNLSHDVKATYNFNKLYPFLCQPVYPGDTWNVRAEAFLRTMPLLAPVLHDVDMHIYFFFVPNRLIWNHNKSRDWKTFITGGEDGTAAPTIPNVSYNSLWNTDQTFLLHRSLLDHMGFPTISSTPSSISNGGQSICTLPFRAYQLIWNEYFRNQNVQSEISMTLDSGSEPSGEIQDLFSFRYKNYEKDYFTSCLPWAQRGTAVRLPISGTTVPTTMSVEVDQAQLGTETMKYALQAASLSSGNYRLSAQTGLSTVPSPNKVTLHGTASGVINISSLNIGTINDFRYCLRLQQWLENNARCGSRYIEQLFAHFGVKSSDARLQRPELLGGGKIPIIFTDVPQTSYGTGSSDDVVGDLAGKGTLYGKTGGFKKYFEEHGVLMGICCIIPRTSYSQGIPRVWQATDKTDWYFPEFAHLGEQAVLNKEVYYNPIQATSGHDDNGVFGYQGRFTELRYIPSSVHGEMRDSLAYWHMGRLFANAPSLNSAFVTASSDARCFALTDVSNSGYDPFVCQLKLFVKAVRPMPKYAVPTL